MQTDRARIQTDCRMSVSSIRQLGGFTPARPLRSPTSRLKDIPTTAACRWTNGEQKSATRERGQQILMPSEPRGLRSTDTFGSAIQQTRSCWRGLSNLTRRERQRDRLRLNVYPSEPLETRLIAP